MSNNPARPETASSLLSLLPEEFLQRHEMFEPYTLKVGRQDTGRRFITELGQVVANDLRHPARRTSEPEIIAGPLIVILRQQTGYGLVRETDSPLETALRNSSKLDLHFTGTRKDLPTLPRYFSALAKKIERQNIAKEWPFIVGLTHQDVALVALRLGMRNHTSINMNIETRMGIEQSHRASRRLYGRPVVKTKVSAVWLPTSEFIALGKSLEPDTSSRRRGRLHRASSCPLRPAK